MATRVSLVAAFSFLSVFPLINTVATAQATDAVQVVPDVENAKFRFLGAVTGNNVQVRSGPGDNYYATLKLDKGAAVTVVGIKFDWLKIVPPEGSFSVVGKGFVEKAEGSSTGTVTADAVNVRAGSSLTNVKIAVQSKLKKGDTVVILGEQDGYYQIKPPADAYVYVSGKFVEKVRMLPEGAAGVAEAKTPATNPAEVVVQQPQPVKKVEVAAGPTTRESNEQAAAGEFDRLESLLKSTELKSIDQQPVAELLTGYEALAKNADASATARRIAEFRADHLRVKARAQEDLAAAQRGKLELDAKLAEIRTQRRDIEDRMAATVTVYTAVGQLAASTIQQDGLQFYRLTDPGTGRTLCYVKADHSTATSFIGQFVGVRGNLTNDAQLTLKLVTASEIAAVDAARVGKGISASVVPPSLMTRGVPVPAIGAAVTSGN